MCVRFTKRGLAELVYSGDGSSGAVAHDDSRMEAFREWMDRFEGADPAERWNFLDLSGSDFSQSVWRRLLQIPLGETRSYGEIAREIGRPGASRAVGSAVGANPVAVLVPCHRVVPKTGGLGGYRWGVERKRALLDAEQESGSALASLLGLGRQK
ncbi:MAG: methylated-DNA--[protein]-cysteine S-methyltransferase [Verrucomicrobia bacterium]|nr:methylated-DNA--[protein]-cysteine S-methyltransferase [Verrucomicrobiota bacterium]